MIKKQTANVFICTIICLFVITSAIFLFFVYNDMIPEDKMRWYSCGYMILANVVIFTNVLIRCIQKTNK